jgi:hypothetical protein
MNREEGIKIIAYHIWEEDGCCHGRDVKHWLKAETIWQERNKPAGTVAEIEPSVHYQRINAAGKTKLAAVFSTQQNNKGKSSKGKP